MKLLGAILLGLFLAATQVPAQCCLGARNVKADAPDGRWRVTATSLTGIGVDFHGPYHYRFRFLERTPDGSYTERNSFELKWDTKAHFGMELFVSPTGNGVGVEFPNEKLAFYTREGKKIFDSGPRVPVLLAGDGHNVVLCRVLRMRDSGGGMYLEDARVFLPLGTKVTKQLSNQVIWFVRLDDKLVKATMPKVDSYVRELASADAARQASAREALLFFSHLSIAPLKKELKRAKDDAHRAVLMEVLSALRMWEGLASSESWRDLPFLLSLTHYPDELIKNRARRGVVLLLAPQHREWNVNRIFKDKALFEKTLQWVRDHHAQLRWDPLKDHYVLSKTGK